MASSNYLIGLDLGQAHDYTALIAVEQQLLKGAPAQYHVPHIERFALGTTYPAIVDAVAGRMQTAQLRRAPLIVDATGVGRPVVDMLDRRLLDPTPVMITAGSQATRDDLGWWYVPKRELVSTVQILLQSERLKIARELPDASVLAQELINFEATITESANATFNARQGTHDDLVLALALACWYAEMCYSEGIYF